MCGTSDDNVPFAITDWMCDEAAKIAGRSHPAALMDSVQPFLRPEHATALANAVDTGTTWLDQMVICSGDTVVSVTKDVWDRTTPELRFSKFQIGRLRIDAGSQPMIASFLDFMSRLKFLEWLKTVTGVAITRLVEWRISRYAHGDFITEHRDSDDGRSVRLNYYISQHWKAGDGGELFHRDAQDRVRFVEPTFNKVVVTTIHERTTHWVTPRAAAGPGRVSFALNYA